MEIPNMYPEVLDAIKNYFNEDEELIVDCLLYLSNLEKDKDDVKELSVQARYEINKMDRCEVCGEKFQVAHYREYHNELEDNPVEDLYEKYCPNCDVPLGGWTTCCRRMYNDTKNLHSVKAVRKYLKDYAETIEKKMSEQVADDKQ